MKKFLSTVMYVVMLSVATCVSSKVPLIGSEIAAQAATTTKPKLSYTKKTLYEGKTFTLKVKGTNSKVKWYSSNSKVAKVNQKGVVKAVNKGVATITAKINGRKYLCRVTVIKNIKISEVVDMLNLAEVNCERVMNSIYGSWYYCVYKASDYHDERILSSYSISSGIPADTVKDIIVRKYNETSGYGIAAYIQVLDTNLEIVHTYYDELKTFEMTQQDLVCAKTMIKDLDDQSPKKDMLKAYYNAVNKYYNFVFSPNGSFSDLTNRRQTLEDSVNDAKQELSW